MKLPKMINYSIIAFVVVMINSATAFAQKTAGDFKNKTPEERAAFQTEMMKTKLNLTAEQLSKVEVINLDYARKFEPVIKSSDSKFSRLKQAMSLQKSKDAELKKIFTPEQYKQYEKFQDELKGKLKDKM